MCRVFYMAFTVTIQANNHIRMTIIIRHLDNSPQCYFFCLDINQTLCTPEACSTKPNRLYTTDFATTHSSGLETNNIFHPNHAIQKVLISGLVLCNQSCAQLFITSLVYAEKFRIDFSIIVLALCAASMSQLFIGTSNKQIFCFQVTVPDVHMYSLR